MYILHFLYRVNIQKDKMSLCAYKDAFGVPGTGLHAYRVGDVAVLDVAQTVVGAGVLTYVGHAVLGTPWSIEAFIIVLILLFIVGIIAHRVFCVRTTVDKWLFPDVSVSETKKENIGK